MTVAEDLEPEPSAVAAVFGDRLALARVYATLLVGDGVLRGVIGPAEPGRIWSRHLLNCGVVGELLPGGGTVVDIGSGAGLPGIPLALARPDCPVILVEPLERRVVFLQAVLSALELPNCRVVRGRADEVVETCGGAAVVASRAVAPLAKLGRWSARLLQPGGIMMALKGSGAKAEMDRDAVALRRAGLADVTIVTAGRGIVAPETIVVRAVRRS